MEEKSNFITVLAWLFIIGGGFTTLTSLMQVVMTSLMFSNNEAQMFRHHVPGESRFMFQNFHLFVYMFPIVSITTLVSAIGLLKRENWGRFLFIGIMVFGIFWILAGVDMQSAMFNSLPAGASGDGFSDYQTIQNLVRGFSVVVSVIMCFIFLWIIKKLMSQEIIQEFTPDQYK